MRNSLRFAVLPLLLAAGVPALARGNATRGAAIAQKNCSACHATGLRGASPNVKSPPFRELGRRLRIGDLEEALAEGIVVGHEGAEMPTFEFEPRDIDDLVAHLRGLQARARGRR